MPPVQPAADVLSLIGPNQVGLYSGLRYGTPSQIYLAIWSTMDLLGGPSGKYSSADLLGYQREMQNLSRWILAKAYTQDSDYTFSAKHGSFSFNTLIIHGKGVGEYDRAIRWRFNPAPGWSKTLTDANYTTNQHTVPLKNPPLWLEAGYIIMTLLASGVGLALLYLILFQTTVFMPDSLKMFLVVVVVVAFIVLIPIWKLHKLILNYYTIARYK
jgi:hypothetical protein